MPTSFAASTLPCPAMIPLVPSINIGLINPNSLMLAWICLICFAVCVLGFRARGFSCAGSLYVIFKEATDLFQSQRRANDRSLYAVQIGVNSGGWMVWESRHTEGRLCIFT